MADPSIESVSDQDAFRIALKLFGQRLCIIEVADGYSQRFRTLRPRAYRPMDPYEVSCHDDGRPAPKSSG